LGTATTGTFVNLEVDMLARYMERLMQGEAAAIDHGGVTIDLLQKSGFLG
jgi:riboflavin synthase